MSKPSVLELRAEEAVNQFKVIKQLPKFYDAIRKLEERLLPSEKVRFDVHVDGGWPSPDWIEVYVVKRKGETKVLSLDSSGSVHRLSKEYAGRKPYKH